MLEHRIPGLGTFLVSKTQEASMVIKAAPYIRVLQGETITLLFPKDGTAELLLFMSGEWLKKTGESVETMKAARKSMLKYTSSFAEACRYNSDLH